MSPKMTLRSVVVRSPSSQEPAVQINPYLNFNGNCEEAFTFYETAWWQTASGRRGW